MAPSLEEPAVASSGVDYPVITKKADVNGNKLQYTPGRTPVEKHDNYAHEDLLPSFPDLHWEPLGEIPYADKGLLGDPNFSNLLSSATDIFDYTPKLGTEIHGVNLAKLTDAQKNDLARLISHRGVVFFRGQDDLDIDAQRELGRYFGSLHKVSCTYFSLTVTTLLILHVACYYCCSSQKRARRCSRRLYWRQLCRSARIVYAQLLVAHRCMFMFTYIISSHMC